MTTLVLGLDVGVSGARAAVLDAEGRLLGAGRAATTTHVGPRRAEQAPDDWVRAALAAGRQAVREASIREVAAVGVAALGSAPVLLDAARRPLAPAPLFAMDTRAETQRAALARVAGLADDALSHDHALAKLLRWRDEEPDLWARAAGAVDATGFLVEALTGAPAMDHITAAEYELPGHPPPLPVPVPAAPLDLAGTLAPAAADALGLAPGAAVPTGCFDTYADVAACGVRAPGDACVLLGSTGIVAVCVEEPRAVAGLECVPYPGRGVLVGGWTAAAGSSLRWCAGLLGRQETELADAAAALSPGAGGLLGLPYLAGERTPVRDPEARGVLLGLTLGTSPVELYRALVDAVALSVRHHLEVLRAAGLAPSRLRLGGGGARNAAWLQATADATGLPLDVVAHAGKAIGPCDLALRAIGVEPVDRVAATVEPDPARAARFDRLAPLYATLHPALAAVLHELGRLDQPEDAPG